jgi:hypothetical protein
MDQEWVRVMESRMVRVEESIKGLAPVVMVRDMIEPLQRDVQKIAHSVQELTESDLELKELHKALMVERAHQEEAKHRLEIQALQEKLAEQRAAAADAEAQRKEAEKRRGAIVFVKEKAHPLAAFLLALAALLGVLWGLAVWFAAHYR